MPSGPKFIRFFWPVVTALRDLGGSAKPRDVVDLVVERLEIGDDERAERTKGGTLRVDNQVHWARNYLVWAGLVDGSQRGRWALSNGGWELPLDQQDRETAYALFKRVRAEHSDEWGQSAGEDETDPDQPPEPVDEGESREVALAGDSTGSALSNCSSSTGWESVR